MADKFDRRITPIRSDVAAAHLQLQTEAARFAEGEPASIAVGRVSLRAAPSDEAAQDSELLFGETFTVYDMADGWAWGQAARDSYVGYVPARALAAPFATQGHVTALMAPLFPAPDFKKPVLDLLPLNAAVPVLGREGDYVRIHADGLYLHHRHLEDTAPRDFVAVAERFLGVPYVWGGKTFAGTDCSGLIQTALAASGIRAPRDTDMMERHFADSKNDTLDRGDIVFWKGHMGVMLDEERLLHANAFHMMTVIEPVEEAIARIEKIAGPVTSVKQAR